MPDNQVQEINQPDHPEVEQQNIPEFEQSTNHPQEDNTRMQSQEIRYENADALYRK
jgi:hypothetical protein